MSHLRCNPSHTFSCPRTLQREYLERTVDSLKRKLAKDSELHRTDNLRIMQVGHVICVGMAKGDAGVVGGGLGWHCCCCCCCWVWCVQL